MISLKEEMNNYSKVINLYSEAVNSYKHNKYENIYKLAVIHAFELSLEIGLKVIKCILNNNFINSFSSEDIIKEALDSGILIDDQMWIDMLKTKNTISEIEDINNQFSYLDKISINYFQELSKFKNYLNSN